MRLLITTQSLDRDDPILGFFHGWVEALAGRFERVHVVCLKQGNTQLPKNVIVHSLGKESGENRCKYIFRFFLYLKNLKGSYDIVFSHMNPHYIVMAGWYWKHHRIPIFFWRNHARMNIMTRIAASYAKNVFYTSPYACTRIFAHAVQMPVGIDTDTFLPQSAIRNENSVLFLGRLSSVKRPEIFIEASTFLPKYTFAVYGDEPRGNAKYVQKLKLLSKDNVTWHRAIKNYETPHVYSVHGVYVNLTPEGSMDKTILEAAACGALILVTNKSFEGIIPEICLLSDATARGLASQLEKLMVLPLEEKTRIREGLRHMVVTHHSRMKLIDMMYEYSKNT